MLFDPNFPHVFREFRGDPSTIDAIAAAQLAALKQRAARNAALLGYALHLAFDKTRVVVVEVWRDTTSCRHNGEVTQSGSAVYMLLGTGGQAPTPVEDTSAGFIVIDIFKVWKPLLKPVSAFNMKNGDTFNRQPGCISTSVLTGVDKSTIATYARWKTMEDFYAAFEVATKKKVKSTDDINAAAANMTFGVIRPDYHVYDLVAFMGADA